MCHEYPLSLSNNPVLMVDLRCPCNNLIFQSLLPFIYYISYIPCTGPFIHKLLWPFLTSSHIGTPRVPTSDLRRRIQKLLEVATKSNTHSSVDLLTGIFSVYGGGGGSSLSRQQLHNGSYMKLSPLSLGIAHTKSYVWLLIKS
jgi:hypothetical protein